MNIIDIHNTWTRRLIQMNFFNKDKTKLTSSQNSFLRFNFLFHKTENCNCNSYNFQTSKIDSVEMTESVVKIGWIGSRSRRMRLEKKRRVPFSSALLAKEDPCLERDPTERSTERMADPRNERSATDRDATDPIPMRQ